MTKDEDHRSTQFGRIPLPVFLERWKSVEAIRFRYTPIRLVSALILLTVGGLWAYYLYTMFWGVGMTLGIALFGLLLLCGTCFVGLRLLSWRLFVLRSAIVLTPDALVWRTGSACYLVPWALIDPDGLGIEALAFAEGSGYDRYITIRVGDSAEPIFVVRLYAKLEQYEVFLGELLKRIPREKWKKARIANAGSGENRKRQDTSVESR